MDKSLSEQETAAYLSGDTRAADLLAQLAESEERVESLEDMETLESWEKKNGAPEDYKAFFEECFGMLNDRYPGPSITSDYDKSVIFDAIRRGEGLSDE